MAGGAGGRIRQLKTTLDVQLHTAFLISVPTNSLSLSKMSLVCRFFLFVDLSREYGPCTASPTPTDPPTENRQKTCAGC